MQSALKRNISTFVFFACKNASVMIFILFLFFEGAVSEEWQLLPLKILFCQSSAVYDSVIKMPFYKLTDRVFIYVYICVLDIYVFIWVQKKLLILKHNFMFDSRRKWEYIIMDVWPVIGPFVANLLLGQFFLRSFRYCIIVNLEI